MTSAILVVTESSVEKSQLEIIKASGIDLVDWRTVQGIKPSDYAVVILDTRIKPTFGKDLRSSTHSSFFETMRPEIGNLLQAGGVVFVMAGSTVPVTSDLHYKTVETNYDFLPKPLLERTALSTSESRAGTRYGPDKEWTQYFSSAPIYFKTVSVQDDEKNGLHISYYEPRHGMIIERVRLLARTIVTSEVVACIISWQGGNVVILPPTDDMYSALLFLKDRGTELYKENTESIGKDLDIPGWIQNYRTLENQRLETETETLTGKLADVRQKLGPFLVASSSLYSTSRRLEIAVSRIFSDFDWKVEDHSKTGEPFDYVIRRKRETSKSLVVALTGTTGYIDSKSAKLAQLLGAFPEVGVNGRLVFLVNGSVEKDPASRTVADHITSEALTRLTKNDVCILLVFDLYRLWMDCLDKKNTADQIFESIHGTCGLFKYVPP